MAARGPHKARTRQRIIEAATVTFRERGVANFSLAGLMEAIGLTHGGFYTYFQSKDDLIAEAIGVMFEHGQARLAADLEAGSPAKALERQILGFLALRPDATKDRGATLAVLVADSAAMARPAREQLSLGLARRREAFVQVLRAMGFTAAEARDTAASLIAELVGAAVYSSLARTPDLAASLRRRAASAISKRAGLVG